MGEELHLTPVTGALIVFAVVVCGHRFRLAWKDQAPGWQRRAWLFGVPAALGLLALGFLPLKV
ncbi:hypothetical protein Q5Y75_08395 [Ruegeria sp. 2205SS24-7]|uniref:hypothetical protein n=1 Tax=Ruegeria discodermiae TaxID=3064389 RepID=UPI00274181F9|nr:hypothetical protein [Ruegeria sp. 2205SS24-7]MDP5217232.1 hypothetical protein [Ruegeria sp. 2205SS24-7]